MQALAQFADGSPAVGIGVMVKVTINNGGLTTLLNDELLSEEEGHITAIVSVPVDARNMKITVRYLYPMYVTCSCYLVCSSIAKCVPFYFNSISICSISSVVA